MLRRERVAVALDLREPDRVPVGELVITDGFVRAFLAEAGSRSAPPVPSGQAPRPVTPAERAQVARALDLDLICLPFVPDPAAGDLAEAAFWTSRTDLFVFALIDGGFSLGVSAMGLTGFARLLVRDRPAARRFLAGTAETGLALIRAAARQGAHGIILADDLAYDRGTLVPPGLLREVLAPTWRLLVAEAVGLGLKTVFHSDGQIMDLIPDLIEAGFAGVHSLQSSSGMDIGLVKRLYGRDLCLLGNLDLDLLTRGTAAEVRRVVTATIEAAAPGGGYIFGTSGGFVEGLPVANVIEAYRTPREVGRKDSP